MQKRAASFPQLAAPGLRSNPRDEGHRRKPLRGAPEPAMPSEVNGLIGRIQALWPANP